MLSRLPDMAREHDLARLNHVFNTGHSPATGSMSFGDVVTNIRLP